MKFALATFFFACVLLALGENVDSIEMNHVNIHSDRNTFVICPEYRGYSQYYHHKDWKVKIKGSYWIWGSSNSGHAMSCLFERKFYSYGGLKKAVLEIGADDAFSVYINHMYAYCTCGHRCWRNEHKKKCHVTQYLRNGMNKLDVYVWNRRGPGGLIYRLRLGYY